MFAFNFELISINLSSCSIASINNPNVTVKKGLSEFTIDIWKFKLLPDFWQILRNSPEIFRNDPNIINNGGDDDVNSDLKFTLTKSSDVLVFFQNGWKIMRRVEDDVYLTNNVTNETKAITWWDFWLKLDDQTKEDIIKNTNNNVLIDNIKKKPETKPKFVKEYEYLTTKYKSIANNFGISHNQRIDDLKPICEKIVDSEYVFRRFINQKSFKFNPFFALYHELLNNVK
jgi:hypothetical protein